MSEEEIKEEEIKDEVAECDGNCKECTIEECSLNYDFEPIHKKNSIANIFSLVCKVIALVLFIFGTYEYIVSVVTYISTYAEVPSIIEVIYSWMSDVLLNVAIFFGIGEITNLANRIKESIMY